MSHGGKASEAFAPRVLLVRDTCTVSHQERFIKKMSSHCDKGTRSSRRRGSECKPLRDPVVYGLNPPAASFIFAPSRIGPGLVDADHHLASSSFFVGT